MLLSYQKPLSGKSVGVVFGSFAPLHQGHLDIIYRAKKENDGGCIVICCGYSGDKGEPLMPLEKRYRYTREMFVDDDLVAVYAINDTEIGIPKYPNGWDGWLKEFERIYNLATVNNPARKWYVGDETYFDGLTERNEQTILVNRIATNPICATMIRNNPYKYWDKIAPTFRRFFSHNILIAGTASEGKTTLTKDLGKYFNALYSYEWPRDYMVEHALADTELDGTDFIAFLQGQYELNRKMVNSYNNTGIFFADTDSMVTRMYAEYYSKDDTCGLTKEEFEKVAIVADEFGKKSRWDKIFLLAPHGVFVDDHSRYMAHSEMKERKELFDILCDDIKRMGDWDKVTILTGGYYDNFINIVNYVNNYKNNALGR